jgi:hypothetical protein
MTECIVFLKKLFYRFPAPPSVSIGLAKSLTVLAGAVVEVIKFTLN